MACCGADEKSASNISCFCLLCLWLPRNLISETLVTFIRGNGIDHIIICCYCISFLETIEVELWCTHNHLVISFPQLTHTRAKIPPDMSTLDRSSILFHALGSHANFRVTRSKKISFHVMCPYNYPKLLILICGQLLAHTQSTFTILYKSSTPKLLFSMTC